MLRRALGPFVALSVMLGAPRTARAELQVERSEGADSCPDAASFSERVHDGGGPSDGAAEIKVRFEHVASGYRSWIRMADGTQRSLSDDGPSCEGLAEATVLAVRLALDVKAPPPPVSSVAPVPQVPRKQETPVPSRPRSARTFAELSAGGVVAFGIASPVASGVRASAALLLGQGRWSIGITGLALPSQTREIGDGKVDVSVVGGGAEGCGRSWLGRSLLLALCGRLEGMRLEGNAQEFDRSENHARPLFAGTLLGRARAAVVGPVSLFVEAGAMVPFVRERFSIDTIGIVFDPPVVAAATGIGVVVDFE